MLRPIFAIASTLFALARGGKPARERRNVPPHMAEAQRLAKHHAFSVSRRRRSRHEPHQGVRECRRRMRQIAAGVLRQENGVAEGAKHGQ